MSPGQFPVNDGATVDCFFPRDCGKPYHKVENGYGGADIAASETPDRPGFFFPLAGLFDCPASWF
jgi:hypothetical protein